MSGPLNLVKIPVSQLDPDTESISNDHDYEYINSGSISFIAMSPKKHSSRNNSSSLNQISSGMEEPIPTEYKELSILIANDDLMTIKILKSLLIMKLGVSPDKIKQAHNGLEAYNIGT